MPVSNAEHAVPSARAARAARRADGPAALLLLGVVLAAHGGSLGDGLFFDDHWHRATLRDYGWSWSGLIESATFDLPGRLAHLWWLEQPLQWRYARPVAMLVMKIEYLASGGNPVAIHAFGLLWHWLCALLVYRIALWAIPPITPRPPDAALVRGDHASRAAALLAGVLFILHPQSVFGVSWIAARNAPVSAFFFLAALHLYGQAAVSGPAGDARRTSVRLVACMFLWVLSLFSRETAVVFPLLLPLVDGGLGGLAAIRRRVAVYGVFGALLAAYLAWRLVVFPTGGPPGIYFTTPQGADYVLWAGSKLLHMVFAHIVHTPMFLGLATPAGIGSGRLMEHGVMLAVVGLVAAVFVVGSRGVRGRWVWPVWTVLAFLPVIPVFVMPHFSYLPAAATAIMIPLMLHRLRGGWRAAGVVFVVIYAAWPLVLYRYAWRGIVRSEQVVYADIGIGDAEGPPPAAGPAPTLYFLNLPACGIYATVAMREAWQRDDVEGFVLTFAPHPLMMTQPSTLRRVSDHEFTIETPPPGYFSGLSGELLRRGMRPRTPLRVGDVLETDRFSVTLLAGDASGITKLGFRFREPLDSAGQRFYLCTPDRPALRVNFAAGHWNADGTERDPGPPAPAELGPMLRERAIYFRIVETARRFVRSDLYLTGD